MSVVTITCTSSSMILLRMIFLRMIQIASPRIDGRILVSSSSQYYHPFISIKVMQVMMGCMSIAKSRASLSPAAKGSAPGDNLGAATCVFRGTYEHGRLRTRAVRSLVSWAGQAIEHFFIIFCNNSLALQ